MLLSCNGELLWTPLQYQYWLENGMGKTDIRDEIMNCHIFPSMIKRGHFRDTEKTKVVLMSFEHIYMGFQRIVCCSLFQKKSSSQFILYFFSIHSLIVIYEKHYIIDIIFMVLGVPLIKTTKLHFPSSHPLPILLLFACTTTYYSLLFTWLISPYCYGPWAFNLQKSHMYAKLADP